MELFPINERKFEIFSFPSEQEFLLRTHHHYYEAPSNMNGDDCVNDEKTQDPDLCRLYAKSMAMSTPVGDG